MPKATCSSDNQDVRHAIKVMSLSFSGKVDSCEMYNDVILPRDDVVAPGFAGLAPSSQFHQLLQIFVESSVFTACHPVLRRAVKNESRSQLSV